mgnify:FL=1
MAPLPPTISVSAVAELLGISKSSAYEAARTNNLPTKVLKIGGRYVVPTKPLLEVLGLDELPASSRTDELPKEVA